MDYQTQNQEQIEFIAQQFAIAYENAAPKIDSAFLQRQLKSSILSPNIISGRVFNSQKKLISEIGNKSNFTDPVPLFSNQSEQRFFQNSAISITPLLSPRSALDTSALGPIESNDKILSGWLVLESNTADFTLKKYRLFSFMAITLVAFMTLFALIAIKISNRIANPVNDLNRIVEKISQGQFNAIKQLKLPQDYLATTKGLTEINERLENSQEEMLKSIEQATEDMRRNMDSMEEKSAQLHIANKETSESNRLKTQFLANMSHEVRTPLNAILGYTQLLQKDKLDNQQRLYINTIEQSTNNLLAIIGDILDFSKIEAGKLNLEQSEVNIRELIDDVYQILSANLLTHKKPVDLIPEVANEVPEWLIGDAIRIRQILTNLIGNAIKFTHDGFVRTKVTLEQQRNGQPRLLVQVIDTGIGIPENKLNSLFKAFSQVNTSTTRQFGGTGLGLVITKKLVEQMGGEIEVNSESGVGSNFRFRINLHSSNHEEQPLEPINKNILVFEPSKGYRQYLENYLTSIKITPIFCTTLEHLIRRLNSRTDEEIIDAVLLSVSGEDKDIAQSYELAVYASESCLIPCILMTQLPNKINQHPELQQLAKDVLLKPISHKQLYKSLSSLDQDTQLEIPTNAPASFTRNQLKVLAVDDNQINLQLVSHWLTPNNIDVSLAHSGQAALDLCAREQFDLILMDIQMPEMDGMETTRRLRQHKNTTLIPIIALTAHALSSEKQEILKSGMNAYLTKPVNESKLLEVIQDWCLSEEPQIESTQSLEGVFDIEKSLSIVNDQVSIARDMFNMLADSLESEKKLIKHHFKQKEVNKLIQVVHRLHGASKYCGTPNLTKHAGFLESHLKELGLDEVDEVLLDFVQAIDELLEARSLIRWPQE
ncbi:response regulator [Marinomonas sp. MED121]|uniref:response regulator n=1 Tax=Marinomonas sp. MED121 TaxID=314277 RepID=UPI001F5EB09F|nr:response regulator [Marinomonas sp. MED121]